MQLSPKAALAATALAALGLAAAPPARAQILQNSSFESVTNQLDTFNGKPVYSNATSWTTTGDVRFTGAEGTSDGSQAAVFNGGQGAPGGTLSQTFLTHAGTVYTVTFDFGAFGSDGHQMLAAAASDGGTLGGTSAMADGPANTANFTPYHFQFTADSASTTLTFTDTSSVTNNIDGVLDHVQIVAPEPSSVAAFAFTGLFAVGLTLRARRRRPAV